jgi:hypothetical protein
MEKVKTISSYRCSKCEGLIVRDTVLSELMYWINMLRCVNCGKVQLEEVIPYAVKTENRRTNKLDELELYKTRNRNRLRTTTLRTFTY